MSTRELQEQQFEIGDVTFGGVLDTVKLDSFDPGSAGWDVQDADNPFSPSTYFGRDVTRGPEWTFEMVTDGGVTGEFADARHAADRLAVAWRDPVRHQGSWMQTLRYNLGGETRRVYGRGRKFDMDVKPLSFSGTAPISATFQLFENIYFSDYLASTTIPIVSPESGGLVAPLEAPLTSMGETVWAQRGSVVMGSVPTPAIISIKGPVLRPWVKGDGFYVQFDGQVASDQTIEISAMGKLMVIDNFGRYLTNQLSASTKMSNTKINPGMQYFTYGGIDATGSSQATVSWRAAYTML